MGDSSLTCAIAERFGVCGVERVIIVWNALPADVIDFSYEISALGFNFQELILVVLPGVLIISFASYAFCVPRLPVSLFLYGSKRSVVVLSV